MSSKKCLTRVSSKKCLRRVLSKNVPQECQIRVSSKSVLPERSAIVSNKGVLQDCHLSMSSQGVPQVGSLEISVSQHTCRHSGSWVSSCFFFCSVEIIRRFKRYVAHGEAVEVGSGQQLYHQQRGGDKLISGVLLQSWHVNLRHFGKDGICGSRRLISYF